MMPLLRALIGPVRVVATMWLVLAPMHAVSAQGIGVGAAADTGLRVSRYHALLIGVSRYADAGFAKLSKPVEDARSLRDILIARYRFAANDVKMLANPRKADILDELQRLSQVLGRDDNLLIFFAGHGDYDERDDRGFWMPADARRLIRTSQLSNDELVTAIRAIHTRHTLLIADVCFGGAFRGDLTTGAERLYALPSRKIMTSGAKKELVPDNSPFLQAVLRRLETNKEPYLRAVQLFADIQLTVANNSRVTPQYKPIQDVGDEGGEFLFPLNAIADGGGRGRYVDDHSVRPGESIRGGSDSLPTEPMDIVQSKIREFVQYVATQDIISLGQLNYTPKPGAKADWKENFLTLVKGYLTSASLAARPDVLLRDGERSAQSEVAITITYRDQVARGEQRKTIRFMLYHGLIGSTWQLNTVQLLDKPPG